MKYVIYAIEGENDYILLDTAKTDEEAKDLIADQLRQSPAANIQAGMIN